jgi:drug/metabolite transporter (DMT)-like permease
MKHTGIVLACITAIISGISIFSNAFFVSRIDPFTFIFIRNLVVVILLTALIGITGQFRHVRAFSAKEWGLLAAIGVIGGGIPFVMFFSGLPMVGAVNGNILQKTLFIWVALFAVPLRRERISTMQLVGYCTLFVALFLFGGTYAIALSAGSFLIMGATVLWAMEHIIAKNALKRISPIIVSWGRMLFGIPCLLVWLFISGRGIGSILTPSEYVAIPVLVSSVFLICYMSAWYTALSKAPATLVSSVLVFAPVVTALLTAVTFHRTLTSQQSVQMILLTVGTLIILLAVKRRPQHRTV